LSDDEREALKITFEKLGIIKAESMVKEPICRSFLSPIEVNSCLPGILLLSHGKSSAEFDKLSYPNLGFINETFNAIAPQFYKKADRKTHPLFELAVLINQLFGMTYISDLSMLAHLVSISYGVNCKLLLDLPHPELRAKFANLSKLRDVFFLEKFNFIKFRRAKKAELTEILLSDALSMLEDYLITSQLLAERKPLEAKRARGHECIEYLVSDPFSSCIVM
jgi:hypothetical protein